LAVFLRNLSVKQNRIDAAWKGKAECEKCAVREVALFADLQQQDFSHIHLPIDELFLDSGHTIYSAGDDGTALYTVRTGLVKLVQFLPDGSQRIVRLLRHGDTLGLEAMLMQPYEHTAVILQAAQLCRIPREVVEQLSAETPRMHMQLMNKWHRCVQQADDWLLELSTGSAKARVARLLLHLVDMAQLDSSTDQENKCTLFSREDVGAMLGVTTETASRTVAEFKRRGYIEEVSYNNFVCDCRALRQMAGE
jgi:CRP-like cAMP-binding protein